MRRARHSRGRGSPSAFAVLAANACLIEPTPGFDASTTSGTSTTAASAAAVSSSSASGSGSGGSPSSTESSGDTTTGDDPVLPLPPRGYQSRPCGFDFDKDGIVGERSPDPLLDECDICNGTTEDPDGDGFAQPMLYVDCDAGVDPDITITGACRDPVGPCKTINRANREIPFAGGPADEHGVVCFRGTCREMVEVRSGRPEIIARPATGIERRAFDYPAKPSMIVGWDSDADGDYPPHDADDVAVLEPTAAMPFALQLDVGAYNSPSHDVELAHFVVSVQVEPGVAAPNTALLSSALAVPVPHERIHVHDLSIRSLRQGRPSAERPIVGFDLRGWGPEGTPPVASQLRYFAIENVEFRDHGGFIFAAHADVQDDESGPIRIANLTTTAQACDKAECAAAATTSVWRVAGWVREVEILSSVFDAGTDAWYPHEGSDAMADAGPTAIVVGECSHDVAIVHNEFVGWATAVRVEANGNGAVPNSPGTHPCQGRNVDLIRIEGNVVRDTSDRLVGTTVPWVVRTAHPTPAITDANTVGLVEIVNNATTLDHGLVGCAWLQVWGAGAGPVRLDHNTCIGAIQTNVPYAEAALIRVLAPRPGGLDPIADVSLRGQLFAGQADGDVAILLAAPPGAWTAADNVFSPGATFRWQTDGPTELPAWRAVSGQDAASVSCEPALVPADFHLDAQDICAGDRARPLATIDDDIDGDVRPAAAPWDAGADQRP